MSLVSFQHLINEAERGQYAVGYFECWNLESLLAIVDAAETLRSPVFLGFSGIYLPTATGLAKERLSLYAALGLEACRRLSVPACLIFNESSHYDLVLQAIDLGFGLVMFTDENLDFLQQRQRVSEVVKRAHRFSVAVEGELTPLPGMGGELSIAPEDLRLTEPELARIFVDNTGIDALGVNVGQAHLHARAEVRLSLARLAELRKAVSVPLVLHGASSISRDDLREAIRIGVRKVNFGSVLKRSYFEAMRLACGKVDGHYNPYEVMGSGLESDVLEAGKVALQRTVEDLIGLLGSADKDVPALGSPRERV